jgi:hypothetical protein
MEPNFPIKARINILITQNKHRVPRLGVLLEGVGTRRSKSHKFPHALIVLLWFVFAPTGFGTEIIVIKTNGWIVLAADSLHVRPGSQNFNMCKIHERVDLFWAASGVESDEATGFRIEAFFEAVDGRMSVPKILDAISPKIVVPLRRELPILKEQAPERYAKLLHGGAVLSLFAVRMRGSQIEAYVKDFAVVNGRIVPHPVTTCQPTGSGPQKKCILAPQIPEVKQYIETQPDVWQGDVTHVVDVLMDVGQKADPDYIGPPFSILAITSDRPRWLRKNDCPEIR